MVWNDEFNGATMDTAKWRHWLPGNRRNAVNTPGAVSVGGGLLTISTYTIGGTHYTGMISTESTYNPAYGYIEARINYDGAPGMWSAFWMQSPTMGSPVGSPNAAGTEIDICEHRKVDNTATGIDGMVVGNIHWDGYGASHKSVGYNSGNLGLGTGFHVYGLEWTPTQQKFYVDGVLRWTVNDSSNSPVSQRTEFLILSSEVDDTSTDWAGAIPAGGYGPLGTTTAKMEVDYVRVYQRRETVVNGDFEGQLAPFFSVNQGSWSATGGHSAAAAGKVAPTTSSGASVEQTVRGLMPSTGYVLTAWGDPGAVSPSLTLGVKNHGGNQTGQTLNADGYARATVPFTTGSGNRTARVFASSSSNGSTGYADDFFLRRSATVTNGQFETGGSGGWSAPYGGASVSSAGDSFGGDYALAFPVSGSSAGAEQDIAGLQPNTAYRLTGWTTNGGSGMSFGVKNHGGLQVVDSVTASTWTQGEVNFTTGTGNTTATIFAYRSSGSAAGYVDALFLSQPLAAPWAAQDVTAIPLAGTSGRLGDKFVIQASGAGIGGTSDRMHFVSQPLSGDTMITARILGVDSTSPSARTGVMIRESNSSFVRSAMVGWTPGQTLDFIRRSAGSAASTAETVTEVAAPPWVRLARRGNVFTAYSSSDGVTWARVGTPQTISMNASVIAGIPVCSGNNGTLVEVALDNVSVGVPVPDVLITSPAGNATTVRLGSSLALAASVADSGKQGTLTIAWSKVSGPGTVSFSAATAAATGATFSAVGTYILRCMATTTAGSGSDEISVIVAANPSPDASLALRWKFDETAGATAADTSGNGLNGTVSAGITWLPSAGVLGGAADFNGSNASITIADRATLDGTAAFTLSFWFKANAFNAAGLVSKRVNFSDNNSFSTFLGEDGKLNVDIDSNNDRFTSAAVFNRGAWYHIALVFDGSQPVASRAKLYVNGSLNTTADETSATVPNYNSPLNVGILHAGATTLFDGQIDDVRFYRRALDAAEVALVQDAVGSFAPYVSAGPVPVVTTGIASALSGNLSSEAGAATATWTKVSGPGAAVFGDPSSSATTVTIDQPGTYVLRLTATNSFAQAFDEISVNAALPLPLVAAVHPSAPVSLSDAADILRIAVSANSNGLAGPPPVLAWTKLTGPGAVDFGNASASDTTAAFSAPGSYVLRCTATTVGGSRAADIGVAIASQPALTLREGVDGYSHSASFLRSDVTTWNSGARDHMLVGKLSSSSRFRAIFSFPLTGIPSNASLTGISLDVWTHSGAGVGSLAAVELRELLGTPVEGIGDSATSSNITGNGTGATWDSRTGQTAAGELWASGGGDFGNATLSSVVGFDATVTGVSKSFPSSTAWLAVAQAAHLAGKPLDLAMISPATESGATFPYTRISSDDSTNVAMRPRLNITWSAAAAPALAPGTAPTAYAGTPAMLSGSASGASTSGWSLVSGPGSASFANASQPATAVTFSQAGSYVLKWTASNASAEVFRMLPVDVLPALDPDIFTDWQKTHWPAVTDPTVVGTAADPDSDGLVNLIEFALGLSPTLPGIADAHLRDAGSFLEYIYSRSRTVSGVAFLVEWSDSLAPGNWSSSGVSQTDVSPVPDSRLQTIKAVVPRGSGACRFVRLRIISPVP